MKVPPFVRKTSGLQRLSFINGKKGKTASKSSENSLSSDDFDPVKQNGHHHGTPSVASTNSDSSSTADHGQEVELHTATMAAESGPVAGKKKRTRSFQNIFRGRRTFALKADRRRDFSLIESPIQSPTPVILDYDPSVDSESTYGGSEQDYLGSPSALDVRSRSLKKLAPPRKDTAQYVPWLQEQENDCIETESAAFPLAFESESNPFDDIDPSSVSNPFDNIDQYTPVEDVENESQGDAKSAFSIPLSYFLRKDTSWGVSAVTDPSGVSEDSESKIVMQEHHWGKEVRRRSRDGSTSWIPTEEERYKVMKGFCSDDDQDDARDDESSVVQTEVTDDTDEYTNDTASSYTGYHSETTDSIATSNSYVTATTGDVSMFSLGVDESSDTGVEDNGQRGRSRRRRHMIKSDRNLFVEVFSDLQVLAEDLADDKNGCRGCLGCGAPYS